MNLQDRLINIIIEAHQAYVDTHAKDYDPYAGPIARGYKKAGRGTKGLSKFMRSQVSGAKKRLKIKLGVKSNPRTMDMVQAALLHRRGKGKGQVRPLPPESKEDREADWREDQRRRRAPGDK